MKHKRQPIAYPLILFLMVWAGIVDAQKIDGDDWKTYKGGDEKVQRDSITNMDTLPLPDLPPGTVQVYQDSRLDSLIQLNKRLNEENPQLEGYRVQIFFGERKEAKEKRSSFLDQYPDAPVDLSYLAPNFRVRVGNYRTRLQAQKALHIIKGDFPNAYIVQTTIDPPELGTTPLRETE